MGVCRRSGLNCQYAAGVQIVLRLVNAIEVLEIELERFTIAFIAFDLGSDWDGAFPRQCVNVVRATKVSRNSRDDLNHHPTRK
jgi:hypothetical protein